MYGPLGCRPNRICMSMPWRRVWSGWILPLRPPPPRDGHARDKGDEWERDGQISDLPSRCAEQRGDQLTGDGLANEPEPDAASVHRKSGLPARLWRWIDRRTG